jgi:iron complex outermembrane receptor protein
LSSISNSVTGCRINGGAFAHGASGASLRGLTTDSTLVLFDGLRAAYYPLSDDGERNFVDLNTIPDFVLDRIEVLQDGASSTYGADAVAGVINIITKKNFQGVEARAEDGVAEHGGAGHSQASLLYGIGDIHSDGWNFYFGGEYQKDEALYNRQRGRYYNTADQSYFCGVSATTPGAQVCRNNGIVNGLQYDGTFRGVGSDNVAVVRAVTPGTTSTFGNYQLLNPSAGCGSLTPVTITPAKATVGGFSSPVNLCQQDLTKQYGVISPERSRYSVDGRFTKTLWTGAEGYLQANFYEETVNASGTPNTIRAKSPPGPSGNQTTGTNFFLPVYICPTGVGCNASNGTLNPNNPFAAAGDPAALFYRFGDVPVYSHEVDDVLRVAAGFHGVWGDGWNYSVDGVVMTDQVTWTRTGAISVNGIQQAINTGAYNFLNPSLNNAAVHNLISPADTIRPHTYETEVQANLNKDLWVLPGGPVQLGVGVSHRSEGLYDPTANPETSAGITTYFGINAFAASGSRTVESGYYELDIPVLKAVDINTSGRYDDYSTGATNFSPKVGFKFKPFQGVTLRSTYSTGFRIPSFAETGAAPTTGYVTYTAPASFLTAHNNDGYGNAYSVGQVTIASTNLRPETSTNFTAGIVFEPTSSLAFTLDYFRIEKKNVVVGATCYSQALSAYYASGALSTGACGIRLGDPDPNYLSAKPVAGYVTVPLVNADSQLVDGVDFSATGRLNLFGYGRLTSTFNGTYLNSFNQTDAGTVWKFAGTQGPNGPTAGSGSPRWRLNWENDFDFGKFGFTAVAYYTSGMETVAADDGEVGKCGTGNFLSGDGYTYGPGASSTPIQCHVNSFTDVDLHARYDLTKHWQVYIDIQNLFDAGAPFDPTSYAGTNYQPAWGSQGILGRYFKLGAKAKF